MTAKKKTLTKAKTKLSKPSNKGPPKKTMAAKSKPRQAKPVEKPMAKVHPFANFMRMQTVYQSNAGHAQKFSSYEVYRKKAV